MSEAKFKRVLLKLSGEALSGEDGYGINAEVLHSIAEQITEIAKMGIEVGVVVGGGNIWRGLTGTKKRYYPHDGRRDGDAGYGD